MKRIHSLSHLLLIFGKDFRFDFSCEEPPCAVFHFSAFTHTLLLPFHNTSPLPQPYTSQVEVTYLVFSHTCLDLMSDNGAREVFTFLVVHRLAYLG